MFEGTVLALGVAGALAGTTTFAADPPDSTSPPPATEVAATEIPGTAPGSPAGAGAAGVAPAAGWREWQSALAARGVTTSGSLTAMAIGDVAGGRRTGGTAQSLAFAATDADLEKLTGWWKGGHAFVNAAFIRGKDLSNRFVGDALMASNLEAYNSLRLYDAWIEQSIAGGRMSVRTGSIGADEEFASTQGGSVLTNSAFGWEAGIGANVVNGGPIYFVPGLGIRFAVNTGTTWHLRAGAYDGDSFDSPNGDPTVNAHGLHFQLNSKQGAFLLGEGSHEWGVATGALPGNAKLGVWRHTADFPDERLDSNGAPFALSGQEPAEHRGNDGVYGVMEQKLWNHPGDPSRGLSAWSRVAGASADRSLYSSVVEFGLHWAGPLPARAADGISIGFVSANVSADVRQQVRESNAATGGNAPIPDWERVVEAAYQLHAGAHLSVTPDLQWVLHPGTTSATPNATVAGLRVSWQ